MEQRYKNWQCKQDVEGILWLTLSRPDSAVNSLNQSVVEEFANILESIENSTHVKAVVIQSGKDSGFIAGADVESFTELSDVSEATELVRQGQKVFDKLAALKQPTIAMIQGFCLGGGLELALACRYRIAEDNSKTRLGLPEVKLGIHPGWGGTVRLLQLIGHVNGLDLILSGRTVSAKAAYKMGIVDAAVPLRQLKRAVKQFALIQPASRQPAKWNRIFKLRPARELLAKFLRNKVKAKARPEHYPSPFAVIDNWVKDGASGAKAMENEAKSIGKLLLSSTSKNLVRIFFLQEKMKGLAKKVDFKAKRVHVIGAGTMGGDIAAWCVLKGMSVTLQDREAKYIAPAIGRAHQLFKKKLKTPRKIQEAMDRLMPDVQGGGIQSADVIIEAIYENLEAKQNLFKELETKAKPDAILASNTSSIPLASISSVMSDPSRLVGIHFFNPVAMMPLVEVIQSQQVSQDVLNKALAFVGQIDRLPLVVKSSPGFLVNRVLMPYLMESMQLVEDGYALEAIDYAALKFGMPMGPVELADTVGLDVCLSVAKNLTESFGGEIPEKLVTMVEAGDLGKKSGRGFYQYKKGKAIKSKAAKDEKVIMNLTSRLIYRMLNEAAACLREGVVEDIEMLDAGMIFGTGFAPFRGGPMHYANELGKLKVLETFQHLQQEFGDRFIPDAFWQEDQQALNDVA